MKYIMYQTALGKRIPFIFPDDLIHVQVAERLASLNDLKDAKPVNAGSLGTILALSADGRSSTMNLRADPRDATTITVYDYARGEERDLPTTPRMELLVFQAIARSLAEVSGIHQAGTDYRELLRRYIAHVFASEGSDFFEAMVTPEEAERDELGHSTHTFTRAEQELLRQLRP